MHRRVDFQHLFVLVVVLVDDFVVVVVVAMLVVNVRGGGGGGGSGRNGPLTFPAHAGRTIAGAPLVATGQRIVVVLRIAQNGGRSGLQSGRAAVATDRMRQRMTAQIAVAPEHLVAHGTLERLVIGVREDVRFQIRSLVEAAIANVALVRRLLHVQDFVHGQRARLAESLSAVGAFERFLLGVDVAVDGMEDKNGTMRY